MRLASYVYQERDRLGVVTREGLVDVASLKPGFEGGLIDLLATGPIEQLDAQVAQAAASVPWSEVELQPIVSRPGKILCLGLNYRAHAREGDLPIPEHPVVFLRAATSLAAAERPVKVPSVSEQLDFEGELALVIGKGGTGISAEYALSHVAGYAVFNDITVRDYQWRGPQWTIGKNFDGTGILGPILVTPEELPPGATGLAVRTRINGELVQDGNTADMIFSVAETIASLSETMTLEPGDVIATGTPAGVGAARKPPLWLRPGDICEVEIEGIGAISTPIR